VVAVRVSRTALVERLRRAGAPTVTLLEAPGGYGKSWLARRVTGPDALRLRGTLASLDIADTHRAIVVDDAHLLDGTDLDRLVELIEDAVETDDDHRILIAGRIIPDVVHHAAQFVDGTVLDSAALAVTVEELEQRDATPGSNAPTPISRAVLERVVEAADGCIHMVATALDQAGREASADAVAIAARMTRSAALVAQEQLSSPDVAMLALVARVPAIERALLDRLAGHGFIERCLVAGVPLRRLVTGELDLAVAAAFRNAAIAHAPAAELAGQLIERGRPLEAVNLLLDAGLHDRAAQRLAELGESFTDTVEPRALLALLGRLGAATDRNPALLLHRAAASRSIGQVDHAAADIDLAVELAAGSPPTLRHRVQVEAARARITEGRVDAAVRIAEQALVDLGAGEERTYARAYELLAECAASSDARTSLQQAAECYHVAAVAWDGCGEHARARATRCDLAIGVLVPLGRFDEALALFGQILDTAELSDTERSWTIVMEGFALQNANRLDSAEARFVRAADLGYVQDNPRLVASAAWGRSLVAARRGDLTAMLRWITSAENTALSDADDVLGIPFLCDAATGLGALGELDLAQRYLDRAVHRRPLFADRVASTAFVLEARRGRLGDLDAGLRCTPPAEWWRVHLLGALVHARRGEFDSARQMLTDAEHELTALGLGDAVSLGEGRAHDELHTMLQRAPAEAAAAPRADPRVTVAPDGGRRLCVIGEPMIVHDGETSQTIPAGNPQRLVGVVVAAGGSASFDQLSDAIWPGDPVAASRARLRNVLMRVRRVHGEIVVRSGSGVRLAAGLHCDLHEFERLAADAMSVARDDPDFAGHLAAQAIEIGTGTVFVDFEYEEWAVTARRSAEQRMLGLLDLLSVQAEDNGDLAAAQALAERALRLDRYTDSRYVRLSELLAMQNRAAAAVAVLDDAAEVARELGGALPPTVLSKRDHLVRRTALS